MKTEKEDLVIIHELEVLIEKAQHAFNEENNHETVGEIFHALSDVHERIMEIFAKSDLILDTAKRWDGLDDGKALARAYRTVDYLFENFGIGRE